MTVIYPLKDENVSQFVCLSIDKTLYNQLHELDCLVSSDLVNRVITTSIQTLFVLQ